MAGVNLKQVGLASAVTTAESLHRSSQLQDLPRYAALIPQVRQEDVDPTDLHLGLPEEVVDMPVNSPVVSPTGPKVPPDPGL